MLILFSPYLYLLKLLTLLFPIWGYLQRNYSYLLEGSTAESRKVLVISTVVEEHVWYQVVFSRWSSSKRKEIMTAVLVFAQISILCWKYQKLQIAAPPESSTHARIVLVLRRVWASIASCAADQWNCELPWKVERVESKESCQNTWNWLIKWKSPHCIITQINHISSVFWTFGKRHVSISFWNNQRMLYW